MSFPSNGFRYSAVSRSCEAAKGGGADRDRTDDLMLAKHALSQLSYVPIRRTENGIQESERYFRYLSSVFRILLRERRLVGLGRFELPTSRLSSARSNQLSYKPDEGSSRKIHADRPRGSSTERKGNEGGGKDAEYGRQKSEPEVGETLPIHCFLCLSRR